MTAVEYIQQEFLKKLTDENYNISFDEIIEKAKAIEKQQIIDAYNAGESDGDHYEDSSLIYYIDTFKIK